MKMNTYLNIGIGVVVGMIFLHIVGKLLGFE